MKNLRGPLPAPTPAMAAYVDSFVLALRVEDRSKRTRDMYSAIALWYASWSTERGVTAWEAVDRREIGAFFIYLQDRGYAKNYRNNAGRCLQQFFKWLSKEEELPNPFDEIKPPPPPKAGEVPKPIVALEQLAALLKDAEKGRDFASRRDAALLRMFASTGCRLAEITRLRLADVDMANRTATVTGKGSKIRTVKFNHKCALAMDRYLRKRAAHPAANMEALWIGERRRIPMTSSGVSQVIKRRARSLGLHVHPHLFRHTFSHNWLDAGGAEGDLMELMGWDSPQMLRHYGASARSARARRAYDRVEVMGGI